MLDHFKVLREIILRYVPTYEVILGNQGKPTPGSPFFTILITELGDEGQEEMIYATNGDDLDETVSQQNRYLASLNAFSRDSDDLDALKALRTAKLGFSQSYAREKMEAEELGFINMRPIRDLSALEKGEWERRGQADLFYYAVDEITELVTGIDSSEITGKFDDQEEIYDITINVERDSSNDIIFAIDTTQAGSGSNTFIFPMTVAPTESITIFWGDGSSDVITTLGQAELTHVYAVSGVYQINIEGS